MKNLSLRACGVVRTSNMKISRRPLADYVKNCTKKRAARATRLFFSHSTNQITYLWRCRGRCRGHFLSSLLSVDFGICFSLFEGVITSSSAALTLLSYVKAVYIQTSKS